MKIVLCALLVLGLGVASVEAGGSSRASANCSGAAVFTNCGGAAVASCSGAARVGLFDRVRARRATRQAARACSGAAVASCSGVAAVYVAVPAPVAAPLEAPCCGQ